METLNIGVDLGAVFQIESLNENEATYLKGILFSFLKHMVVLNHQVVEIVIFSTANPCISPRVFESFSHYNLPVDQVIFTGGESVLPYLKSLDVEVYLSIDSSVVAKAQSIGILAGVVSNQASCLPLTIAFDHRLFLDEVTYAGLGKLLPLLGFVQQQDKNSLSVELMTTRSYSVDRWIKDLFLNSQCKINAVCFIASGRGEDFLNLFDVNVYFEGERREEMSPLPTSECILNIDF